MSWEPICQRQTEVLDEEFIVFFFIHVGFVVTLFPVFFSELKQMNYERLLNYWTEDLFIFFLSRRIGLSFPTSPSSKESEVGKDLLLFLVSRKHPSFLLRVSSVTAFVCLYFPLNLANSFTPFIFYWTVPFGPFSFFIFFLPLNCLLNCNKKKNIKCV